mmetsp:Transcript_20520/g.33725  ORF Transcript_20520/g.33725 Transcript_20520/m.33725 type:complete len:81 (+) Transcript_20520:57-299(+)
MMLHMITSFLCLFFLFSPKGDGIMCEVEGHSSSDTWYAVLDNGTNYCNLHNLVEAAELEFKEWTSDSVCTQYSSADCLVY